MPLLQQLLLVPLRCGCPGPQAVPTPSACIGGSGCWCCCTRLGPGRLLPSPPLHQVLRQVALLLPPRCCWLLLLFCLGKQLPGCSRLPTSPQFLGARPTLFGAAVSRLFATGRATWPPLLVLPLQLRQQAAHSGDAHCPVLCRLLLHPSQIKVTQRQHLGLPLSAAGLAQQGIHAPIIIAVSRRPCCCCC